MRVKQLLKVHGLQPCSRSGLLKAEMVIIILFSEVYPVIYLVRVLFHVNVLLSNCLQHLSL